MKNFLLSIIIIFSFHCAVSETATTGKYVPPSEIKPSEEKEDKVSEEEKIEVPEPVKEKVFPVPSKKTINYKIQIFASNNKEASKYEASRVLTELSQTAEVINDGGLWKVHIGAFSERKDAESFREKLRNLGWRDAFIINVEEIGFLVRNNKAELRPNNYFSVQVLATEDRVEARSLMRNIIELKFEDTFIVFKKNLWKVRVGRFSEKVDAEKCIDKLKNIGFSDCWIVETSK